MPDRSSRRCALAIVVALAATLLAPGGEVHASGGDLFASAEPIGVPAVVTGDTSAATPERHEPRPCGRIATTAWFKLQPATGTLTASTAGSAFDTVLALYRGSALAGLTSLACNDDFGGTLQSQERDWKSTRLNSSHVRTSYAAFFLQTQTIDLSASGSWLLTVGDI